MTTEQSAREAVRRILGETARADITAFPAGSVSITIHSGDHYASISGATDSGWGWEVDPGCDNGFTGYPNVVGALDEALLAVREQFAA
ncbi:hypothetical protein ABZZ17_09375 [Streptomyces sp. NPDC006512]|uniref:hypothetical protein n=1 Tax=Streptomyces sp. NPDC006512 TaxID=3154307 RepID=UPI0033A09E0C